MKWWITFGKVTALVILFSGCASTPTGTHRLSTDAFSRKAKEEVSHAKKLEVGDIIEITVEVDGRMEIAGHQSMVNDMGVVTLPLIGDVEVSALRLHAARKVIAKKYRPYYVNAPVIMLSMVETAGVGEYGRITVMGHVSRPGSVPLSGARGMKLSAAIQGAGGFSKSAKKSDVRVTRTDNYGRKVQTSVDFDAIGRGGSASADIQLFNGDVVYVPERVF